MAVVRRNSFDGGTAGSAITTANSGGLSGNAFTDTSRVVYATNGYPTGLAGACSEDDSFGTLTWGSLGVTGDTVYSRLYVRFSAYPADIEFLFRIEATGGGGVASALGIDTVGKIRMGGGNFGDWIATLPTTVPLNQWVRLESRTQLSGSEEHQAWLYLDPDSLTHTDTSTESSGLVSGSFTTATYNIPLGIGARLDTIGLDETKLGPAPVPGRPPAPRNITAAAVHRASRW
jgi:hypothetical protein